jgi:hypothetical protein
VWSVVRVRDADGQRAAIYARVSTDKQSEASCEDQVARCREYAERQGWQVVESLVVSEYGISGASRHNRPGFLDLMARITEWDVLLAYDFARLSRSQEDTGWLRNELQAHEREAVEASTGNDLDNIGSRVMGVVNEEYRLQIAKHTHRVDDASNLPMPGSESSGQDHAHILGVAIPCRSQLLHGLGLLLGKVTRLSEIVGNVVEMPRSWSVQTQEVTRDWGGGSAYHAMGRMLRRPRRRGGR